MNGLPVSYIIFLEVFELLDTWRCPDMSCWTSAGTGDGVYLLRPGFNLSLAAPMGFGGALLHCTLK